MIDPGAYWSHRIFDLDHLGQVNPSRLKAAWTAAASQLDILRTVFCPVSELSVIDDSMASTGQWASKQGISIHLMRRKGSQSHSR
jgi:hypothetical protein